MLGQKSPLLCTGLACLFVTKNQKNCSKMSFCLFGWSIPIKEVDVRKEIERKLKVPESLCLDKVWLEVSWPGSKEKLHLILDYCQHWTDIATKYESTEMQPISLERNVKPIIIEDNQVNFMLKYLCQMIKVFQMILMIQSVSNPNASKYLKWLWWFKVFLMIPLLITVLMLKETRKPVW